MSNHVEHMGRLAPDDLFSGSEIPVVTALRELRAGQGELKRGTVLALSSAGDLVVLGTAKGADETLTANCVLCDDTDVGSDAANAMVYLSGHFCKNRLRAKEEYTLTAADVEALRAGGVYLDAAMTL